MNSMMQGTVQSEEPLWAAAMAWQSFSSWSLPAHYADKCLFFLSPILSEHWTEEELYLIPENLTSSSPD